MKHKPIQISPAQASFIKIRRRVLKAIWEEKKARLIAEGVPPESLEIPRPRKKNEE